MSKKKLTANEEFLDAMIRHQTYLLRYSDSVRNSLVAVLNKTEDDLARRIRDALRNNKGLTGPSDWKRLQSLQSTIATMRAESWQEANMLMNNEMLNLAYQEPMQLDGLFTNALPVLVDTVLPAKQLLKSIVNERPFEGRLLKQWADSMLADDIRRINAAIQAGMITGEGSEQIARRVVGTGAMKGADGVTEISRRQVQAITRTAVQHIANASRNEYFALNSDIISQEYFVATLDSRTTPVCRANDGKTFPLGKGPQPPLHFSCRSLRIAQIDGTLAGDRPANPTTQKMLVQEYAKANGYGSISSRDGLPRGSKGAYDKWERQRLRELVGPIPASTTYNEWLKRQSVSFQEDTLGITKAKLFRDGNLSLDKFVNRNGGELTLAELSQREPKAFNLAGIDLVPAS